MNTTATVGQWRTST